MRISFVYPIVFDLSAVMSSTFGSSAPTPALKELGKEFNVSPEVTCLTLTLFLIGFASGPILWGPGSELFGRRPVFLFSMACYILFQLGQALSRNIETFLITRLLSGIFAASPMSNCAGMLSSKAYNNLSVLIHTYIGVIADIWDPVGCGQATSLFTAAIYVGPGALASTQSEISALSCIPRSHGANCGRLSGGQLSRLAVDFLDYDDVR